MTSNMRNMIDEGFFHCLQTTAQWIAAVTGAKYDLRSLNPPPRAENGASCAK